MQYKILLVDDDPDILEFLGYNLRNEGYIVETAENGLEALKKTEIFMPDLIILDVMMPEMDGIEACQEIRKNNKYKEIIIVFLTARGEDYSQIVGFESGADDYITKPIKPKVFISKLKAILRRKETGENDIFEHFKIDRERFVVILENNEIEMPKKEFEIIELLASKPEKVFTREEIYEKLWGEKVFVGDRTIDVHIRKIREKLGEEIIKTVKGVGYKFQL